MKKMVLVLFMMVSVLAQANAANLVRYEFGLKSNDVVKVTVKQKNNQLVLVADASKIVGGQWSSNKGPVYKTKSITLSPTLVEEVKETAQYLSEAKIESQIHQVICMMMPAGYMHYDHLFLADQTNWRLVDSPKGCWNHSSTHPVEEYAKVKANELELLLKSISVQLLGL